jgi:DNA-binding transcriptional MerR regulator
MAVKAEFSADTSSFVREVNKADKALFGLKGSFQDFDGILASLGVNIGAEARALGELSTAAGKTATELGLVGTAGLIAGAAFAGWKIGRVVADLFDLDKKIGDVTAKLLGFGDVAGAVAGAKADVLAKASKAAGIEIKDMALAMAINEEVAKTSAAALKARTVVTVDVAAQEKAAADAIHASNERMVRDLQRQIDAAKPFTDAMVELNSVGMGWQGTLDTIDGTVVEGIKYYLNAGVSLKALAEAYGLTDAQVKAVSSSMKNDTEITRTLTAETEALTKAHAAEIAELDRETAARKAAAKETEKQAAAIAALKKANREMGNSTQFDMSSESGRAAVPEGIRTWLHDGYSLAQASQIDFLMRWGLPINANDPLFRTKGPRVPGFAGGVENFSGGLALVGERGPELVNLPSGSSVTPLGGGGDTYNFYLVDNTESLARKVSGLIMAGTRRGGKVGL